MRGPIVSGIPHVRWDPSKVAITFDGNSLVDPAYSDLCTQLQALAPLNSQLTIANKGISGQTIIDMTNSAADVDAAWVAGKKNVLLVWEFTNNVHNIGRTGMQSISDMTAYIGARQSAAMAAHGAKWIVVLMTTLPRGDHLNAYTGPAGEVELEAVNTYLRANYRAMGASALVEMRQPGGPFNFTDVTNAANFPSALWTDETHPNSAGKAYCARYIADVLKRLPTR